MSLVIILCIINIIIITWIEGTWQIRHVGFQHRRSEIKILNKEPLQSCAEVIFLKRKSEVNFSKRKSEVKFLIRNTELESRKSFFVRKLELGSQKMPGSRNSEVGCEFPYPEFGSRM